MNSREQREDIAVYEALRSSIVSSEDRIKNATVSMYVVYFAMLTFGFHYRWLLYISFMVLMIFQAMINDDRLAIEKTSIYIRIFFEEEGRSIHWESLHKDMDFLKAVRTRNRDIAWFLYHFGASCLSLVSFFALIVPLFQQYSRWEDTMTNHALSILAALGGCLLVVYINSRRYVNKGEVDSPITQSIRAFHQKCYPREAPAEETDADTTP